MLAPQTKIGGGGPVTLVSTGSGPHECTVYISKTISYWTGTYSALAMCVTYSHLFVNKFSVYRKPNCLFSKFTFNAKINRIVILCVPGFLQTLFLSKEFLVKQFLPLNGQYYLLKNLKTIDNFYQQIRCFNLIIKHQF